MELSGIALDAFLLHHEDHCRRELEAELYRAEAEAWEPVRRHLARMRGMPTWQEQQELRRFADPWKLRATPGWPPIAIPGKPGEYLTYDETRQAAA